MGGSRVTLKEVAALAGVSLGSASNALSQPAAVRPDTLAKVRAAAVRLGYTPNPAARALAGGRSGTIGLLVPTLVNDTYAVFTQAAQRAAALRGVQLITTTNDYDQVEGVRHIRGLIRRGVDGLIITGAEHDTEMQTLIDEAGLPYTYTWYFEEGGQRPSIGISNYQGARDLVRHLLDLGHRKLAAIVVDPASNDRAQSRAEGIYRALADAGCALPPKWFEKSPGSINGGRDAMARLLALDNPPTAIIAGSDYLAGGAITAAIAHGLKVPQDISVTGFDDVNFAVLLSPALTTIRAPAQEIGTTAVNAVIDAIGTGLSLPRTCLPCDLIVRGSTAPPPPDRPRPGRNPARRRSR